MLKDFILKNKEKFIKKKYHLGILLKIIEIKICPINILFMFNNIIIIKFIK